MGQQLCALAASPGTIMLLSCDGCGIDWGIYSGPDYIKMRDQAHADGWRRRNNQWFLAACIPKGKDDAET
jgi:hypothetical protein